MTTAPTSPGKGKPRSILRIIFIVLGLGALAVVGAIVILVAFLFWDAPDAPKLNRDTAELRNKVNIDIPMTSVKWQIFRWPDGGFPPAPDPFTLLVAEIELADPAWFKPHGVVEYGAHARNAARPWLSEPFKSLMTKAATDQDALAAAGCGRFESSMRSSGRPVSGFICKASGKILIYLTLDAPS